LRSTSGRGVGDGVGVRGGAEAPDGSFVVGTSGEQAASAVSAKASSLTVKRPLDRRGTLRDSRMGHANCAEGQN
jgi:hypothetical protein